MKTQTTRMEFSSVYKSPIDRVIKALRERGISYDRMPKESGVYGVYLMDVSPDDWFYLTQELPAIGNLYVDFMSTDCSGKPIYTSQSILASSLQNYDMLINLPVSTAPISCKHEYIPLHGFGDTLMTDDSGNQMYTCKKCGSDAPNNTVGDVYQKLALDNTVAADTCEHVYTVLVDSNNTPKALHCNKCRWYNKDITVKE